MFRESHERNLRVVPGGQVGVSREFAAYSLETNRSMWRNPEAQFVQMVTINRAPHFFEDDVERGYASNGMAMVDRLDQRVMERFADVNDPILDMAWSDSPDELRNQIAGVVSSTAVPNPPIHAIFNFAINMLAEPIDPETRAAAVELLASIDLTSITPLDDGSVRLQLEYDDGFDTRQTVTLRRDGSLRSREIALLEPDLELGLPAGTVTSFASYSRWSVVTNLDP